VSCIFRSPGCDRFPATCEPLICAFNAVSHDRCVPCAASRPPDPAPSTWHWPRDQGALDASQVFSTVAGLPATTRSSTKMSATSRSVAPPSADQPDDSLSLAFRCVMIYNDGQPRSEGVALGARRAKGGGHGGYRPGSGRKPLPPEKRRGRMVAVLLTEAEHALLREVAGDVPAGTYARNVLLRHLKRKGGRS